MLYLVFLSKDTEDDANKTKKSCSKTKVLNDDAEQHRIPNSQKCQSQLPFESKI